MILFLHMQISRIYDNLQDYLEPNKVLVIYGPRRVGKTTLIQKYLKTTNFKYRFDTGDDLSIQSQLSHRTIEKIKTYIGDNQLIVIDEAQNIPNISMILKLMVDHFPGILVVVTGSASFDLSNKIGEPLVGRKWTKILYPVSQYELSKNISNFDLQNSKEQYLIYGSYPETLITHDLQKKQQILLEIANSYLLKDILALEKVKNSLTLVNLLKLIALQLGSEVSLNELGNQLDIDKKTVQRYLDLLEKTFIITRLNPYHHNIRKAVMKTCKYYFWDLGIRNAIIQNFNTLDLRNDIGALWENFLVIERIKKQSYQPIYVNNFFWRTWDQKEIDWVEMREGKLFGFEFKWKNNSSKHKKAWLESYPKEASFSIINQENYLEFISRRK